MFEIGRRFAPAAFLFAPRPAQQWRRMAGQQRKLLLRSWFIQPPRAKCRRRADGPARRTHFL